MNMRSGTLIAALLLTASGVASAEQTMPTDMDVIVVTAKSAERTLADRIAETARATARSDLTAAPPAVVIEAPAVHVAPLIAVAPQADAIG